MTGRKFVLTKFYNSSGSSCARKRSTYIIRPVKPGFLYVAEAPVAEPPLLSTAEVVDPPLPAVAKNSTAQPAADSPPTSGTPTPTPPSSSTTSVTVIAESSIFTAILTFFTVYM